MPLLAITPETSAAVLPHLQPTTASHPGGMLVLQREILYNKLHC